MGHAVPAAGKASVAGIRLVELLAALSLATDLANEFPMEKGLRNCLLAFLIGQDLGLAGDELADVYYFGLLRSVGCTSYAYEEALATGDDRNFRNSFAGLDSSQPADMMRRAFTRLGKGRGVAVRARAISGFVTGGRGFVMGMGAANCEAGARLAERMGMGKSVCEALAQVHERWDGKGIPNGVAGESIELAARIGCFAHDVTVHRVDENRVELRKMVRRREAGSMTRRCQMPFSSAPTTCSTRSRAIQYGTQSWKSNPSHALGCLDHASTTLPAPSPTSPT